MDYRLATPKDAKQLLELNNLFNGEGANNLTDIIECLTANSMELVCVACEGKTLAGFCSGQVFKSFCYDVPYGEITELFVLEVYRRQGVATGLLTWMETEFNRRGISHFQLFTGTDNHTAQAFYRKMGYAPSPETMFRKRAIHLTAK